MLGGLHSPSESLEDTKKNISSLYRDSNTALSDPQRSHYNDRPIPDKDKILNMDRNNKGVLCFYHRFTDEVQTASFIDPVRTAL
jgi:hypothetical protein